MSIEGPRHAGPRSIPVLVRGEARDVHPDRVAPYSLESAQRLVDIVRLSLRDNSYQLREHLVDLLDHLNEFLRAAGEVRSACERDLTNIAEKRDLLKGDAAAGKLDSAIELLKRERGRHSRMASRLRQTVLWARQALAAWRNKPTARPGVPPANPDDRRLPSHMG